MLGLLDNYSLKVLFAFCPVVLWFVSVQYLIRVAVIPVKITHSQLLDIRLNLSRYLNESAVLLAMARAKTQVLG